MRQLVDTEEAAEFYKVSPRTIERWFEAGKLEGEFKTNNRGGKSGMKLYVYINDRQSGDSPDSTILAEALIRKSGTVPRSRTRVGRGEPGCHVVTPIIDGEPAWIPASAGMTEQNIETPPFDAKIETSSPSMPSTSDGGVTSNLPAIVDAGLRRNDKCNRIANLRFALIQAFNEGADENHPPTPEGLRRASRPRKEIINSFLVRYHAGLLLPDIHAELKKIKRSTLYNWLQLYDQGGIDALVPQYRGPESSTIAPAEKQFLLGKLLDQNKPTIGDSINKCKFLLGDASPSSPAKLRRFVNEFRKNNHDIWTLEREGEKALNDKCVPYAEREWRDLAVGEAVVADGHKLNFQVVNPFTGKPTRAMMVMFWDWKSSYPLGWEIMLTESIQCVVAALRNSIITLGKFPKHALLDNGKAFRANIFRKEFRFQETEIPGIFDKLNITPHFAMPYNAQSKPIERFFRTFNDWFERELPSYTGASIPDKPARMNRNEKRARDLHDEWVPTIPEAMELIFRWREYYIDQALRARDGQRPRDIFEAEKGPGVDPFALHFLMMTCKARMVHRNGITFNGWHWYHENLYGLKDYVLMFYSYYDLGQVYIFTMKNEFLCVATPVEKVKPFAADSEFPEDMASVQQINATKRKCVHTTKKLADMLQSQKNLYIDWNREFRDRPEVAEAIKQIEDKKSKVVNISPFANSPEPEIPVEEENKCPFDPPVAWARYEFHLKGGKYRGTEMDKQFMEDFRSGKIAPGLWESLYAEKERLESEEVNDERKVCHY
jgi:putative transposase